MRRALRTAALDAQTVARWGSFTADANPLHTDAAFAATTEFGVPIVHGHLVASLALDALHDVLADDGARFAGAAVRFRAPVPVGTTVELLWDDDVLTVREQDEERVLVEARPADVRRAQTRLTRAVVDAYAEAAHDANSIHMSDEAARASGFDGAIAHGMLTLGWAVGELVQHIGLRELRSLRARFAAPAPVGDPIGLVVDAATESTTALRVLREDGTVVLTLEAEHDGHASAPLPDLPADADVVADTMLCVSQADAVRLARAVGVEAGVCTDRAAAEAAGFSGVPVVPTLVIAATVIGHLADDPANAGAPVPDPVRDCESWTRTDQPVVHAGQEFAFARPMLAGERLRARTAVLSRSERVSSSGKQLRFTAVRTVFSDTQGEIIALSEMNLVVIGD